MSNDAPAKVKRPNDRCWEFKIQLSIFADLEICVIHVKGLLYKLLGPEKHVPYDLQ